MSDPYEIEVAKQDVARAKLEAERLWAEYEVGKAQLELARANLRALQAAQTRGEL